MPQFEFTETRVFKYIVEAPNEDAAFDKKIDLEPLSIRVAEGKRELLDRTDHGVESTPIWDVEIQQNYADDSFDRAEMTIMADDPETVKDKVWEQFDKEFDAVYARGEDIEHAQFVAKERHGDRTIEYTV